MKIIEIRALRGPNYYSGYPVIFMKLDIQELETKTTDLVPDFNQDLSSMIPTLYEHKCSPGRTGGFYMSLVKGTWAGHVVERVAIELQQLMGHEVAFGKTFTTDKKGNYNVVFRYLHEDTGLRAGTMSVDIIEKLFKGILTDVEPLVNELKKNADKSMLGPSTLSIVEEAARRGIPHIRLNEDSYVQLGQGVYQRRLQATIMDSTSYLGVEIARDKARTKSLLSSMGIPVSKGYSVYDIDEALIAAKRIGYPVVVKPQTGNHGRGITTNITGPAELLIAYKIAEEIDKRVIVEKYLSGFDFRILVIDGKFVAAARRNPPFVIGNGKDSIKDLIDQINEEPDRGSGHEKSLTQISMDYSTKQLLAVQECILESILEKDKKIYVKSTVNLSCGGTAEDVTDTVHPLNRLMAERISRIVNLNVVGIDIIADSLEAPLTRENSGVLEVNAAPGFRMHLSPSKGKQTNIASNIVDMLFPPGTNHSVPIVAVTGTNGKTTTTRLISHILSNSGSVVGMTSTDSVKINNNPILRGDYSGPGGAHIVLMDSTIDHAILEVARGGILRRGLGFSQCDVGVMLNVSGDHLGDSGINTLEELSRVKSTVIRSVKPTGYAVLNADDPLVLSCIGNTKGCPILFSRDSENSAIKTNFKKGNPNVLLKDDKVIIQKQGTTLTVASVMEIPITFNGKAGFNIDNVLAAVAATTALGLKEEQIRAGLMSFNSSVEQAPGRMNVIDMGDFKVMIDYGHNPGAIIATGDFAKGFMPGRKIRMSFGGGNRKDEDLLKLGIALSQYYDHIILCDPDIRKREFGETAEMIKKGLLNGGFTEDMITTILDEKEATKAALEMASTGDLVVLQANSIGQVIQDVLEYKKKLERL